MTHGTRLRTPVRTGRARSLAAVAAVSAAALVSASCADNSASTSTGALVGDTSSGECVIDAPVPVGAALSLTGDAGIYGQAQKNGLELALAELNARGGVTYNLRIEDDATDQRQGITVFERFIDQDNVSAIIGPTLSNAAKVTDPIAQERGVPVLGISNTAAGITEIGDFVFRNSLTEAAVIPQTVAKVKETLNPASVVVMYSNDDAFTESGYQAFSAALAEEGITVSQTLTFSKSDSDFRALLTEARNANPDAIVVSALIQAAIPLVTQARELGITVPIVGGNGFNAPKLMADAGAAAEGVIVGAAWNSASEGELNTAFQENFTRQFDNATDQFAAQAYTGLILLDHAVRAGCSGEREDIQENLAALRDVDTALGTFSFDENRDAVHPAVVQIVRDGAFAVLE
jgi:branched-chain amino acid transport system substrate-binding protein